MSIRNCSLIELPKIVDPRGNLTFVEENRHIPFAIKRVYYLYDVPNMSQRGGHAHKTLQQLLICLSGSFDILLDDGTERKTIPMNKPNVGLLIVPGIWREMTNFSSGSVCLVLASDFYQESDYYRNYEEFIRAVNK